MRNRLTETIRAAAAGMPTLVLKNANVVNVFTNEIVRADVAIYRDTITGVGNFSAKKEIDLEGRFLCPGFVDAHVHIESSMATPSMFAQAVLPQGTTTVIADPHEIANVCGKKGVRYMLEDSRRSHLNVFLMLPSCVPATKFEHSGCAFPARDMIPFLQNKRVLGLGEVMDYPAVLRGDLDMMEKLQLFQNRVIDGHAPLLSGSDLAAYCAAGPSTDHECSTYGEVLEKLRAGLKILLRVGSAAHDMQEIFRCIAMNSIPTEDMMFCTDDKHLEGIQESGHINAIARMAVAEGVSPTAAVQMATINPCRAYGIPRRGAIAPGYIADLVIFENLEEFKPMAVFSAGRDITELKEPAPAPVPQDILHSVRIAPLPAHAFDLKTTGTAPVIEMPAGQLLTRLTYETVPTQNGLFVPDTMYTKLAVVERHHALGHIGLGILKNFGLREGAIASTVAHDSHNMIIAGTNDTDMTAALNALAQCGGGYTVVNHGKVLALLALPVAGLMTNEPSAVTVEKQRELLRAAHSLGVPDMSDPFIRLSFMALPLIPEARVTDMGVFDVINQKFI